MILLYGRLTDSSLKGPAIIRHSNAPSDTRNSFSSSATSVMRPQRFNIFRCSHLSPIDGSVVSCSLDHRQLVHHVHSHAGKVLINLQREYRSSQGRNHHLFHRYRIELACLTC